jgi:hypothetical protein
MDIPTLMLEPRLQRRYHHLVSEHLSPTDAVAPGLRALPGQGAAFASTQAAWRFYANPDVTLAVLVEPLVACGRQMVAESSASVALVVHDWTQLDYHRHRRKADRVEINSSHCLGYHLQSALLMCDRTGLAIAPLYLGLWADDGIHTTRSAEVAPEHPHVDELSEAIEAVEAAGVGKLCVHIIDRGADSVAHYRLWDARERRFVVRADAVPRVEFEGETMPLGKVAERLVWRPVQAVAMSGGLDAQQFVAEAEVTITRPACPHRQKGGVQAKRRQIRGDPIRLRLVVSQLRTPDEVVAAEWLLLTNVGAEVAAETIAEWYVWRWKIESFFKLVKSGGFEVEHWQQERAEAIAKRLLVTAMACVVVWQLARATEPEAAAARQLLVRLSGRQMRRDRPWTEPALLAGLWVLLSTLDALERYTLEDLKQIAHLILPGFARYQKE